MKTKLFATAAAGVLAFFTAINTADAGSVPESSDPIKMPINEWTG